MSKRYAAVTRKSRKRQRTNGWPSLPVEIVDKIIWEVIDQLPPVRAEWKKMLDLRRVSKTVNERIVDCLYGHRNMGDKMPRRRGGCHPAFERVKLQKLMYSASASKCSLVQTVNDSISAMAKYGCLESEVRRAIVEILLCWHASSTFNKLFDSENTQQQSTQQASDSLNLMCIAAFLGRVDVLRAEWAKHPFSADESSQYFGRPLLAAVLGGQLRAIKWLVTTEADLILDGGVYGSALHVACYWGHMSVIRYLLKLEVDINDFGGKCALPVSAAISQGHLEVAKLLISQGASLKAWWEGGKAGRMGSRYKQYFGCSPLNVAVENGYQDLAILLLEKGASRHSYNSGGLKLIELVARSGQLKVLDYLMEGSAMEDWDKFEALSMAASTNQLHIVQYLHEKGVELDSRAIGPSPLLAAVAEGCYETVKYLLEQGVSVNGGNHLQNFVRETHLPLTVACTHKQLTVMKLLLEHGAHPDGRLPGEHWEDTHNPPASATTPENGDRPSVDTYRQRKHPLTPLAISSFMGDVEAAEILLKAGADVNLGINQDLTAGDEHLQQDLEMTPAYIAAGMGQRAVQEILAKHGVPFLPSNASSEDRYLEDELFPGLTYKIRLAAGPQFLDLLRSGDYVIQRDDLNGHSGEYCAEFFYPWAM